MALSDLLAKSTNKKQVVTASAAIVLTAAVVTGAVVYPGFSSADVDLNDGSVWVTNRAEGLVGHLNGQSKVLDGGFTATTTNFDVIQASNNVFMSSDSGSLLNTVSVPLMAMESETNLGGGKYASQGTNIISLTDPNQGKVWAMQNSGVPGFTDQVNEPILTGLGTAVSVTAPDDVIYTADAKTGELITTEVNGNGIVSSQEKTTVEGMAGLADLQITVAGGKPVTFSEEAGKLFLPGNKVVEVEKPDGGRLAQASSEGDFVALATATALITAPLDGSAVQILDLPEGASGTAAAPVVQKGCVHSAWSGANKYVLSCNGTGKVIDVPKSSGKSKFVFRQNRDVVVLNDINTGNVWLVNQNMLLVNNWDDLKADTKTADNAEEESADPNVVSTLPDRTKPNRPPVAAGDDFGVRAGKTTILPVLFNDSDIDGDVLSVEKPAVDPSIGAVSSIYDGTGLQITVPPEQAGFATFNYVANDGRGGTDRADVNVRIVPASENAEPYAMRDQILIVEQGRTMKQNILLDWIDPDGDDIFLLDAVSDDESAVIKTTPDGQLSYTDDGEEVGLKTMTVTVSDGVAVKEAKIKVNVKPAGTVPPVANADFFRAIVGEPVVLAPLKNDQDPSGENLRLASVSEAPNARISPITDQGTVTFTSDAAGPVYLDYQVTNGAMSATGLIRVEVEEANKQGLPVAVKDQAMLPSGGSVLVDVLGNDSDPAGGVLVVQSIELPGGSPVSATIVERNIVKLTDLRGLKDTLSIKYTISNGAGSAVGEIAVVRIPAPDKLLPPRVEPDTARVRVGDVVSIPVLLNDSDPNGEVLKSPEVMESPDPELGKLFTDQNELRFIAGPTAKTVQGVYRVANSTGQYNSAAVTISIVANDPEHNQPPTPENLTGRVIAGEKVRIPVPLNGIDPEGDSVELVGINKGPALGTAETGNGFIVYTAGGSSAGTDSFSYRVRDRLGAEAIARVDVGVAQPLSMNHPPVTEDDYITIRPGRKVALDVLLNDSDPDGGQLGLVKDGFEGPEEMAPSVTDKGKALVTSPTEPGIATMMYTAADKFGAKATGNIRMTVSADAPLKAPIARDDRVTVKQMLGKNTVDVPVLENDADPDGVTDELSVSVQARPGTEEVTASVLSSGSVRVILEANEQLVPYTVTDQDGLSSTAVIWVPGLDKQYPVLKNQAVIRLTAGENALMKLADYVQVREGRKPRLTEASKISLVGAPSNNVIEGDGEGINYAADIKFFGPGSITFEVTDGTGPDDPEGLKSTLTVMTLVDPAPVTETKKDESVPDEEAAPKEEKPEEKKNTPPTFTGSMLEVPQQETVTLDLSPMAFDVDPGDKEKFTFALVSKEPANFNVSFAGSVLTAKQNDGTKVGTKATVQISVSDGSNDPVVADVVLSATSTSLPLAVANQDDVKDAHAGRAEVVKVLGNDVNPFPETPLRVVDTTIETNPKGITVTHTDDSVTVTTDGDYKGTVVVGYVIEDKTKDADRHVNGKIRITVKGKPDAPSKPQILEERDKSVLLTWDPPADNGSPLTSYTVNWDGGSQSCATNTCTVTGLKNAVEYRFSATASNAVGESDRSPLSVVAVPDRKPDAPAAPTTEFGDTAVTLRWNTPVGEFSPVTAYNVEISPAPAGQNAQRTAVTGNSLTWTGLSNGTEYQFRVQAVNNAPKPSEWSAFSASVVPAGKPSAPAAPTLQVLERVGNQNQISVNWNVPFANGAPVTQYTLTQTGGGVPPKSYTPTTNNQTVSVGNSTEPYAFSVVATNKAGTSESSPASAPQRAVGQVAVMSAPSLALVNQDAAGGQVQVNYTPLDAGQLSGYSAAEVSYCVRLSTGAQQCGAGSGVVLPSPNGANVSATAWAVAGTGGIDSTGAASPASNTVAPYGNPGAAVLYAGGASGWDDTRAYYGWTFPTGALDIKEFQTRAPGEGWVVRTGNATGNVNTGGFEQTVTIEARTMNSVGHYGPVATVRVTSGKKSPPPPPVTEVIVKVGTWHSCTQGPGENSNYSNIGGDSYCDGVRSPGGDVNLGGKWLDRADDWVQVTSCRNGWYVMSNGPHPGRWVRADTVDVRDRNGGSLRC